MKSLVEYITEGFSNMPPYHFMVKVNSDSKDFGVLEMNYKTNNDIECSLDSHGNTYTFSIPLTKSVQFWLALWGARFDRWKKYGGAPIMKYPAKGDKGNLIKWVLIEPARRKCDFLIELLDEKSKVQWSYRFTIQDFLRKLAEATNGGDIENLDEIIRK